MHAIRNISPRVLHRAVSIPRSSLPRHHYRHYIHTIPSKRMDEMRGAIAARTGGPEVLQIHHDLPVPQPKDGEVVVRNSMAGVNYIDVYFRTGQYPSPKPEILGREAVGTIMAVGPGETYGLQPGDRVCYIAGGAYAEYTAAPALRAFKVPDGVSDKVAAAAYMQGLAATTLVSEAYDAGPGKWALVHAAAGGVGLWLCQLLRMQGVNVVGTASTEAKRDVARVHGGANVVLDYRDDDLVTRVKEVTGGEGVDIVFDGVGKATLDTSLAVLRRCGTLVMHGTASGEPDAFKVGLLTPKNIRLLKPTFMNYLVTRGEVERYARQVFEAITAESVSVYISRVYSLADIKQAHTDLESRRTVGKLLVKL